LAKKIIIFLSRIPFAGKIEMCCFDKTGTLTSDNLVVEGIAGVENTSKSKSGGGDFKDSNAIEVVPVDCAPSESIQVLATCHSLVQLEQDGLVGDPLEKATLTAIDWNLTKGDAVIPKKGSKGVPALKIVHRHHFTSALKRMTVVAGYTPPPGSGTTHTTYIATVKGAPETLKSMFAEVGPKYDETYLNLSRRGARVLAMGWKDLGRLSHQQVGAVSPTRAAAFCYFV
jgi:cation-transporting ATPase 13A1